MIRAWQQRFLARRQPPQADSQLNNANIYILPTAFGYLYLLATLVIFLLGTNYQNNLILLLAFFLGSVFVTTMYLTHRNLAGLQLARLAPAQQVAGADLLLPLQLQGQQHQILELAYRQGPVSRLSVDGVQRLEVLAGAVTTRGWHKPGRLTVASRFPLGLFRAWSYPDLAQQVLVYPAPEPWPRHGMALTDKPAALAQPDSDWQGLKQYQPGESLRQVAWKQLAQGRGMWSKQFAGAIETDSQWLRLQAIPGGLEQQLARLCWQVLDASSRGERYGLQLGEQTLEPASGTAHRDRCLRAIALYQGAS